MIRGPPRPRGGGSSSGRHVSLPRPERAQFLETSSVAIIALPLVDATLFHQFASASLQAPGEEAQVQGRVRACVVRCQGGSVMLCCVDVYTCRGIVGGRVSHAFPLCFCEPHVEPSITSTGVVKYLASWCWHLAVTFTMRRLLVPQSCCSHSDAKPLASPCERRAPS